MELKREIRFSSRVSLVISLLDAWTCQAPIGKITLELEGVRTKAVNKSNGSYIFSDLPHGDYILRVNAEHYFDIQVPLSTNLVRMIEHIPLQPLPSYPFSQGATLIRAILQDQNGSPIRGARVTATVESEECASARLMSEKVEKGADLLTVGSVIGAITAGSSFVLRGRGAKAADEWICIKEVLEFQKRLQLQQPLEGSFSRGAVLLPVIQTRSTERGELVLPFRTGRNSSFGVNITIAREGGESRRLLKEVMVSEGAVTNLGTQVLT
ncbi:hypothetical protein [Paenibacillus hexagrammi]|uniref:Carboxypeptidase regulatory-like domain-containing protein n=1 Tax=Paenibacillus hexagrammi TaxID=2908839 RepID=A0ABY3SKM2_9BACL|nr:hypothetical protein [Paenibacillus sp. YPD9-1]UJF34070.1 hypothetical protein L0M14_02170 [Paenibacillus sp. YPD9-1]